MVKSYPTVTVEEARECLPELLQRVARGERVMIEDSGKWIAMLGPSPPTPDSSEEAESESIRRGVIRGMLEDMIAQKPVLDDGTRIQDVLDEWERRG